MLAPLRLPWAFFLRDMRIEVSYKAGFALQVMGVLFDVAMYYFIARLFGGVAAPYLQAYGGSYFAFVVVGIALREYMSVGMGAMSASIRADQSAGTFELLLLSPTRLSILLVYSTLFNYVFATLIALSYLVTGMVFGMRVELANLPFALLSLLVAIVSFNALGLLSASFVILFKRGNPFAWLIGVGSALLSGLFYPVEVLPDWLRRIGQALPMTHALELLRRSLLLGEGAPELWQELAVLAVLTTVLLTLGILACRWAIRVARLNGSLAYY